MDKEEGREKNGFPVVIYSEHGDVPEARTTEPNARLIFRYNVELQHATICLKTPFNAEPSRTFILQIDPKDICAESGLGAAHPPISQDLLKQLQRNPKNSNMYMLSLTLPQGCLLWYPTTISPQSRPDERLERHRHLAKSTMLRILFDFSWLGRQKQQESFTQLIKAPQEFTGFPVEQYYRSTKSHRKLVSGTCAPPNTNTNLVTCAPPDTEQDSKTCALPGYSPATEDEDPSVVRKTSRGKCGSCSAPRPGRCPPSAKDKHQRPNGVATDQCQNTLTMEAQFEKMYSEKLPGMLSRLVQYIIDTPSSPYSEPERTTANETPTTLSLSDLRCCAQKLGSLVGDVAVKRMESVYYVAVGEAEHVGRIAEDKVHDASDDCVLDIERTGTKTLEDVVGQLSELEATFFERIDDVTDSKLASAEHRAHSIANILSKATAVAEWQMKMRQMKEADTMKELPELCLEKEALEGGKADVNRSRTDLEDLRTRVKDERRELEKEKERLSQEREDLARQKEIMIQDRKLLLRDREILGRDRRALTEDRIAHTRGCEASQTALNTDESDGSRKRKRASEVGGDNSKN